MKRDFRREDDPARVRRLLKELNLQSGDTIWIIAFSFLVLSLSLSLSFTSYAPHFSLQLFSVSLQVRSCMHKFSATGLDGVRVHATEWSIKDFIRVSIRKRYACTSYNTLAKRVSHDPRYFESPVSFVICISSYTVFLPR